MRDEWSTAARLQFLDGGYENRRQFVRFFHETRKFSRADDLIQRHVSGASERDDQFPLGRVLGRFAEAEGRDRQPVLRCRPDRVDRGLGAIEVLGCLGSIEQELEKTLQHRGVKFSLLENERFTSQLVAQYLGVKRRQLL